MDTDENDIEPQGCSREGATHETTPFTTNCNDDADNSGSSNSGGDDTGSDDSDTGTADDLPTCLCKATYYESDSSEAVVAEQLHIDKFTNLLQTPAKPNNIKKLNEWARWYGKVRSMKQKLLSWANRLIDYQTWLEEKSTQQLIQDPKVVRNNRPLYLENHPQCSEKNLVPRFPGLSKFMGEEEYNRMVKSYMLAREYLVVREKYLVGILKVGLVLNPMVPAITRVHCDTCLVHNASEQVVELKRLRALPKDLQTLTDEMAEKRACFVKHVLPSLVADYETFVTLFASRPLHKTDDGPMAVSPGLKKTFTEWALEDSKRIDLSVLKQDQLVELTAFAAYRVDMELPGVPELDDDEAEAVARADWFKEVCSPFRETADLINQMVFDPEFPEPTSPIFFGTDTPYTASHRGYSQDDYRQWPWYATS